MIWTETSFKMQAVQTRFCVVLVLVLCVSVYTQARDAEKAKRKILAKTEEIQAAYRDGDLDLLANSYTEDAVFMMNFMPTARGRPAIRQIFEFLITKLPPGNVTINDIDVYSRNRAHKTATMTVPEIYPQTQYTNPAGYRSFTAYKRVDKEWLIEKEMIDFDMDLNIYGEPIHDILTGTTTRYM